MAENKNKVIIYCDWLSTFESLSDDEAGRLIKHLFRYVNDKNPKAPDRLTSLLFEPIKQTLKRDLKKYQSNCLKNSDNAKVRWNKINATACDRIKSDAKHADSDSDSDSDSDIKKRRKRKPFVVPSLEEVKNYFTENNYDNAAAIKAWMGYDAANWFDSKGNPILNWKQKMINVWFKDDNKINGSERKLVMP